MTIVEWLTDKLAPLAHEPRVLVRDPLRLLDGAESALHTFATAHGFTVLIAATNLVYRDLYERAVADPATGKLLVIDRVPALRRIRTSATQAPPPFYPDLLAATPPMARLELDLRQYLRETTNDPSWPQQVNEPRYARLIAAHLDGVLHAHTNLRKAEPARFSDTDFEKIVAFAALGVGASAFKRLSADDYWRIGLEGHAALRDVQAIAPAVAKTIKDELRAAPPPFTWLADHDPELVVRAFYLSVILEQHLDTWRLLLPTIDPALSPFTAIPPATLHEAAPKLVHLNPDQARRDLEHIEASLTREAMQTILFDQMRLSAPDGFAAALERERYSTQLLALAVLLALDNLLSSQPDHGAQDRVARALFPEFPEGATEPSFADARLSPSWDNSREAYRLASTVRGLYDQLRAAVRAVKVAPKTELTFASFWDLWNRKRLNRLEYYVSWLRRHIESAELLPRAEAELPTVFGQALQRIRQRVRQLSEDIYAQLDNLNRAFQEVVAAQYPRWLAPDSEVLLTSQFLRRSLKANWDPQKEKAVVFVFDGMRYDIWDELLRPLIEDRLEVLDDPMASSLLPSETHISRWGLAAGANPKDYLFPHRAENAFLKDALAREVGYQTAVTAVAPDSAGTGETVRYRAGNLEYFIFELCDKELHKIQRRTLPDGRSEPSRPLTFIYQMLKDLFEHEVMAIIRGLQPGTKVFITSDHGFGPIHDKPIWFDSQDLNEADDCKYLNCWLRVPFDQAHLPPAVRQNIIPFTPDQLGLPKREPYMDRASGRAEYKDYKAVVFPRVGFSFSRNGARFDPSAYSHGGISIQELLIPMVALCVRTPQQGLLTLDDIVGPHEIVEGSAAELTTHLRPATLFGTADKPVRVDIEASYSSGVVGEPIGLPPQVHYVAGRSVPVVYTIQLGRSDATDEELRQGQLRRTLSITATYQEAQRTVRKTQSRTFRVRLSSERIARRVPTALGNILGLVPKNLE